MKEYFEILQNCSLFEGVSSDDLPGMLSCLGANVKHINKGELIISEGDEAKYIGIVLDGSAQIEQTDYFGNRSITSALQATDIFGETFACAGVGKMPLDVVCLEDADVMFIDCIRITHSCSNACDFHRQIIYNMMRVMAQKNLVFHRKIEIVSKRSTREKLLAYLNAEVKQRGTNSFEIPYDRQQLADYLLVERSGLSCEIGKLRAEGIIECRKNRFTLLTK